MMSTPQPRHTTAASVAAAAAAATAAVYAPQLLTDSGQFSRVPLVLRIAWLVLLLAVPPLVAFVVARRHGGPPSVTVWVGTPLPLLAVLLAWLDVWLEVRYGYLLAGSGEESMAYGIGITVAIVGGAVLMVLVTVAAWLGARASGSSGTRASRSGSRTARHG